MKRNELDGNILNDLLKRHGRAIVHMRQQISDMRFGLVLGAGASADLGFPNWSVLIERIAGHPEVNATHLLQQSRSHSSRSQLLFQSYKSKLYERASQEDYRYNRLEMKVKAGWQRIVHECLYQGVHEDIDVLMNKDQYLWAFISVIRGTRLTINYNFDDSLQRMIASGMTAEDHKSNPGQSTLWSANIQMYPRDGVIYHPNGFLPRQLHRRPSEHLVFLEDTFADQLIDSMYGHYASLSHHLAQNTCLFIGLSLEDATLKHLLRQNARIYPGHYHYYVAFVENMAERDQKYERAAIDSNFEVYNLISLFLTREEIAALGVLLGMQDAEFRHLAEEQGQPRVYRVFLTGPVGVGKSTTVSQFGSLRTHEEWLEQRPEGMEKDPSRVNDSRKIAEIDTWVARQIGLKNLAVLEAQSGINVVDRAPLDAFAFTPAGEWRSKASLIKNGVSPGHSNRILCPGHVILMVGDEEVMAVRALAVHKDTDAERLRIQQSLLKQVYQEGADGVSVVDTREKSISQVTKEIARIIHMNDYTEASMQEWLDQIEKGAIHA